MMGLKERGDGKKKECDGTYMQLRSTALSKCRYTVKCMSSITSSTYRNGS
jgi:hypothetical protein